MKEIVFVLLKKRPSEQFPNGLFNYIYDKISNLYKMRMVAHLTVDYQSFLTLNLILWKNHDAKVHLKSTQNKSFWKKLQWNPVL